MSEWVCSRCKEREAVAYTPYRGFLCAQCLASIGAKGKAIE